MEIILKENKIKLIRWLSADTLILQHVQSANLITNTEYEKLKSITVPTDKTIELLDIILRKGENVCREFLDLLKKDDVNEMYPELRNWVKTVKISETTNRAGSQGTQITSNICASDESSVFAPSLTNSHLGSINMNMVVNSGRPVVVKKFQKTERGEPSDNRPIQGFKKFLKSNTSDLVQNVKNIDPILDDLNLHDEQLANVRVLTTNQAKMRKLLDYMNCESIAERLFNALLEHEEDLMKELQN
ncbi:uncharacterized protein si:dkey-10c21.1 isoform X1 [Myxocyprinus asiaticus]|uniref:uncharacterized protein si:dkey-10c21.1 isoform X1 n=1 Tax=Myxocyprinus asiaticus TaxID=70543 RepID=UPI002223C9DA|nr:uncharacterized protein si:dkey-10c21.1 isoform X1 [Myxocyprinus asiaticus]